MNEQLNLIEFTGLQEPQSTLTTEIKKSKGKSRDRSSQVWWKLSNEERQQGLEGVRAIRAILQKQEANGDLEMAKAS